MLLALFLLLSISLFSSKASKWSIINRRHFLTDEIRRWRTWVKSHRLQRQLPYNIASTFWIIPLLILMINTLRCQIGIIFHYYIWIEDLLSLQIIPSFLEFFSSDHIIFFQICCLEWPCHINQVFIEIHIHQSRLWFGVINLLFFTLILKLWLN